MTHRRGPVSCASFAYSIPVLSAQEIPHLSTNWCVHVYSVKSLTWLSLVLFYWLLCLLTQHLTHHQLHIFIWRCTGTESANKVSPKTFQLYLAMWGNGYCEFCSTVAVIQIIRDSLDIEAWILNSTCPKAMSLNPYSCSLIIWQCCNSSAIMFTVSY